MHRRRRLLDEDGEDYNPMTHHYDAEIEVRRVRPLERKLDTGKANGRKAAPKKAAPKEPTPKKPTPKKPTPKKPTPKKPRTKKVLSDKTSKRRSGTGSSSLNRLKDTTASNKPVQPPALSTILQPCSSTQGAQGRTRVKNAQATPAMPSGKQPHTAEMVTRKRKTSPAEDPQQAKRMRLESGQSEEKSENSYETKSTARGSSSETSSLRPTASGKEAGRSEAIKTMLDLKASLDKMSSTSRPKSNNRPEVDKTPAVSGSSFEQASETGASTHVVEVDDVRPARQDPPPTNYLAEGNKSNKGVEEHEGTRTTLTRRESSSMGLTPSGSSTAGRNQGDPETTTLVAAGMINDEQHANDLSIPQGSSENPVTEAVKDNADRNSHDEAAFNDVEMGEAGPEAQLRPDEEPDKRIVALFGVAVGAGVAAVQYFA